MNQRFRSHPQLLPSSDILHAVRGELVETLARAQIFCSSRIVSEGQPQLHKIRAVRGESGREIPHALRSHSATNFKDMAGRIRHAVRDEFNEAGEISEAVRRKSKITPIQGKQPNQHAVGVESSVAITLPEIGHALRGESWQPGQLHPNLSWTHYRKGDGQSKTGGGE